MEEFKGLPSIDDYLNQEGNGCPVNVSELDEFIDLIIANTILDKSQAKRVLTLFFHDIRTELLSGEKVSLWGLGAFKINCKKGKNNYSKITFKTNKGLLKKLNGK